MAAAARALGLLSLVAAALVGSAHLAAMPLRQLWRAWSGPAPVGLDTAVEGTCAAALAACAGWLLLVTAATVLAALLRAVGPRPGADRVAGWLDRLVPTLVRGLAATAVGVAVTAGSGTAALADSAVHPPSSPSALDGLRLPDRMVGGAPTDTVYHQVAPRTVVVRPGDSLWSIARRSLPAPASAAATADAVRRLYAANLGRIGPDPDLIQPGTRLVLPHLHPQRKDVS